MLIRQQATQPVAFTGGGLAGTVIPERHGAESACHLAATTVQANESPPPGSFAA
jgi:hypothetical protein